MLLLDIQLKKVEFKCLSLLDMRLTKGRVQIVEAPLHFGAELLSLRCKMQEGHFYFINDQYFIDFPDKCLMQNKETIAGVVHNRPSFLSLRIVHTFGRYIFTSNHTVESP